MTLSKWSMRLEKDEDGVEVGLKDWSSYSQMTVPAKICDGGEEAVIQAYEHAVKMARDVTRPAYESLQWAAKAEAYAFALCQYSQDFAGP